MNNAFSFKPYFVLAFAGVAAGLTAEDLVPDADGVISIGSKDNTTITQTFTDLPDQAVSLKKVGTGWTYLMPEGESTFSGGIVIDEGQLRVSGPQAIGTGPIKIGSSGCSLILDGENTVVSGRVTFNRSESNSGWAASLNNLLTFTDINGYAKLGRDSGRETNLALVPRADSTALTNIVLNGAIDLALGGTITIGAETADALFDASLPNTTPNVHVAATGVTFKTAEGANTKLGVPLHVDAADRVESRGCVTVEGAGSLTLERLMDPAEIKVSGGTLVLDPATVPAETGLSVASGARLTLSGSAVNLIVNGGFEDSGCETHTTGAANWTFTKSSSAHESGHQRNGCAMTASGPAAPEGSFTAYLRDTSTMAQTVSVAESGVYRLSFQQACRKTHNSWRLGTSVSVDGEVRLTVPSQDSAYDFAAHSVDVELTAGDHTIVFATDAGTGASADVTGNMVFFDAISLVRVLPVSDLTPVRISLVSGSVLRLEEGVSIVTENLFVNGEKFGGSASRLMRLGVIVEGTGTLKAKAGSGLVILIQ